MTNLNKNKIPLTISVIALLVILSTDLQWLHALLFIVSTATWLYLQPQTENPEADKEKSIILCSKTQKKMDDIGTTSYALCRCGIVRWH